MSKPNDISANRIPHRKAPKQTKLNKAIDNIAMKSIVTVLTTSKGWIVRQLLKATAIGLATFTAYVYAKAESFGISSEQASAFIEPLKAMVTGGVVLAVEIGLSFLARKNQ